MLAAVAVLFLAYARLDFPSHPADWSGLIPKLRGSLLQDLHASEVLASAQTAIAALRNRMHTTWFFFTVFTAVWLACLLWMLIERRRRKLNLSLQEAYWMGWISLAVFSTAVLYGLGTNGIFARRFPRLITVSDAAAVGFMLALPVVAWSRLYRRDEERTADFDESVAPRVGSYGILGLNDDESNARLVDSFSRLEVRPVDLLPAAQIFNPEVPNEQMKAGVSRLVSAELPAASRSSDPGLAPPAAPPTANAATPPAANAPSSTTGFREQLSTLNRSWQHIQTIGQEIEEWFDQQRRQALAHLELHPGLRGPESPMNLSRDFPNEKLAAVDAEWGEIRKAALEISRWFGDVPAQDRAR
jgi:hypothetical protein